MRFLLAAFILFASCATAAAQGCGSTNPNCIVPTAPANTNNNQAASTAFVQQAIGGPAVNVVHGPGSSTSGDIVIWNNALGNLVSDAGGGIPSMPVIHPSSGNLVGAGCSTTHQAWWVDQNLCSNGDHFQFTSSDPSALMQITIGGSVTTGDTITLTYTTASGLCSGGCAPAYTTIGGDTVTTVAGKLACAIANNANLFNLNGGSCTAGVITAPASGIFGGYGSGNQIGYVVANGVAVISIDFNSTVSMTLTSSVSGGATETVTISNTGCNSSCSNAWDGAPGFSLYHFVSGIAPAANSNIGAVEFLSNTSTSLTAANTAYAQINAQAINSTTGSLQGRLQLLTTSTTGSLSQGVYIGSGLYTVGTTDKGVDTLNAKQSWINSAYEILQSSNTFRFDTLATNHPIVFNSGGGYGFGQSPTADDVEANTSIHAFGAGNPTAGTGVSLFGGTPPEIFCFNWSTTTYVACQFDALSLDIQPSGSTSTGIKFSANLMAPDTNNATALGSSGLRWSTVDSVLLNLSGTATFADTGTWGSSGISGTTVNNSAIGGSTAAAGSFTTLSASSTATFTGQAVHNVATTLASATAATLDDLKVSAATTTITGNTGSPITALSKFHILQPTFTDSSAVTVTTGATLTIDNAPAQAGSVTITNAYALNVTAGSSLFGGKVFMSGLTAGSGTKALCLNATANEVQTDTSATICGISALRYKNLISEITPDQGLGVLNLRSESYRYKPEADQDDKVHVSLIADDMAALNPACANYSPHGVENYMDRCFEAYQVAYDKKLWQIIGELRNEIADLRRGR